MNTYNQKNTHFTKSLITLITTLFLLFSGLQSSSARTLEIDINAGTQALPDYETSTTFLKVDLSGIRPEGADRAPLNLALVIDKSGSMSGQKIVDAKNAAIYVIQQLDKNDIVSVVTYSSGVQVLIPATKVSDKRELINRIRNITSNGNTALFAGVSKAAAEVRKFLDKQRINRVILLSDGLANEGPSSPAELGQLGRSLVKEGISVTTLGIGYGYNEDLMTKLAYNSDGNHVFVAESAELADIFSQELGELFTITAKEIKITIRVSEDLEIVRFLGRDGNIRGNTADITLNQVADKQEKYVMIEVRHTPNAKHSEDPSVDVAIDYLDPFKDKHMKDKRQYAFNRVSDETQVKESTNKQVVEDATLQIATINTERAIELRDEGKIEEAEEVFAANSVILFETSSFLDSDKLQMAATANLADAAEVYDDAAWESKRKQLREEQTTVRMSQKVGSSFNRYIQEAPQEEEEVVEPEEEEETEKEEKT